MARAQRPRLLWDFPESASSSLLARCRKVNIPARHALFRQGALHLCSCVVQDELIRTNFLGGGYLVQPTSLLAITDADLRQLAGAGPQILR